MDREIDRVKERMKTRDEKRLVFKFVSFSCFFLGGGVSLLLDFVGGCAFIFIYFLARKVIFVLLLTHPTPTKRHLRLHFDDLIELHLLKIRNALKKRKNQDYLAFL